MRFFWEWVYRVKNKGINLPYRMNTWHRTNLSPTGIDFDERELSLGGGTTLKVGAALHLPRQFPLASASKAQSCPQNMISLDLIIEAACLWLEDVNLIQFLLVCVLIYGAS